MPSTSERSRRGTVLVVDDDPSVGPALDGLLRSVDLHVITFASTAALLLHGFPDTPSCLVLDVRLPGQSGLDVQSQLLDAGIQVPIIFITGYGDIPMSVQAMRAGAIDFLPKPFRDQALLEAVWRALDADRLRRDAQVSLAGLQALYDALRPREREIMRLVTSGLMNKQIANEIGLSEVTVKFHRGSVMKKMGAPSLADLVRMAQTLQLHGSGGR